MNSALGCHRLHRHRRQHLCDEDLFVRPQQVQHHLLQAAPLPPLESDVLRRPQPRHLPRPLQEKQLLLQHGVLAIKLFRDFVTESD